MQLLVNVLVIVNAATASAPRCVSMRPSIAAVSVCAMTD